MRTGKDMVAADGVGVVQSRRRWAVEEKRRIVEETLLPGSSIAQVARTHAVNANQVHLWRRHYERGLLTGAVASAALLPVRIVEDERDLSGARVSGLPVVTHPTVRARRARPVGVIQVEVARGRLRVEGAADPAALRVVLEYLLG